MEFYNANNPNDGKKLIDRLHFLEKCTDDMGDKESAMKCLEQEMKKHGGFVHNLDDTRKGGLWPAESIAINWYTSNAVYADFNRASSNRDIDKYKYLYCLLCSGLGKLMETDEYKVNVNKTLYRGITGLHKQPNVTQIYWKSFTSTSLEKKTACNFSRSGPKYTKPGTLLVFEPPQKICGAKIDAFSFRKEESEVLIMPFQCYDVLQIREDRYACDPREIYFRSSQM